MALDSYAPCPCGSGKKVKFCCAELAPELEKLQRMFEGDQRLAALEQIGRLEAKYPHRAALLAFKSTILLDLGKLDELRPALATFREHFPDNPIALAQSGLVTAIDGDFSAGVKLVVRGWNVAGEQLPWQVYDAMGQLAQVLFSAGRELAAFALWTLQLSMNPEDQLPGQLLARAAGERRVPLVLKDQWPTAVRPSDAPWVAEFDAAMGELAKADWIAAEEKLAKLAERAPEAPAVWQNLAIVRVWLADNAGAAEAFHRLATLDVPHDDAVDAEAMAQCLKPIADQEQIDLVQATFAVSDLDSLVERLLADAAALDRPVDVAGAEDEPPPRAVFDLLDRAMPKSGVELAMADVPVALGSVEIYGKQTDREARAELIAYRGPQLTQAESLLARIGGNALGARGAEEVVDQTYAAVLALSDQWRLPTDTPQARLRTLVSESLADRFLNRWPKLASPELGGKTPVEAVVDFKLRIKVEALVQVLELSAQQRNQPFDFNRLREFLGLPLPGRIDPTTIAAERVHLVRLAQLDFAKLTDEQLINVFQRSVLFQARVALRQAALEVVGRPSLADKIDFAEVYGRQLASIADEPEEAYGYLEKAREASAKKNQSSAPWDIEELVLRFASGDTDGFSRMLEHLFKEHIREPGVAPALRSILTSLGLVSPDGRLMMPAGALGGAGMAPPEAPAAEPGRIWTPDSERPAGEKKSALWTPGS